MREQVSRRILHALGRRTPDALLKFQAQILLDMAARGFGTKRKRIRSRTPDGALAEYAGYTVRCMTSGPADPDRLYRAAYRTGQMIRRLSGLRTADDISRLVFYLYRNIRITMHGEIPGEITVSECYFSHIYTPQQCALMSEADSGFIAGLCGGGRLAFTERITEGCDACRACFRKGG